MYIFVYECNAVSSPYSKPNSLSTISPPNFMPRLTQLPILGFMQAELVRFEILCIHIYVYKYILDCFIMQRAPCTHCICIYIHMYINCSNSAVSAVVYETTRFSRRRDLNRTKSECVRHTENNLSIRQ